LVLEAEREALILLPRGNRKTSLQVLVMRSTSSSRRKPSPKTVEDWYLEEDGKHQYADILLDDLRDFVRLRGVEAPRACSAHKALNLAQMRAGYATQP